MAAIRNTQLKSGYTRIHAICTTTALQFTRCLRLAVPPAAGPPSANAAGAGGRGPRSQVPRVPPAAGSPNANAAGAGGRGPAHIQLLPLCLSLSLSEGRQRKKNESDVYLADDKSGR